MFKKIAYVSLFCTSSFFSIFSCENNNGSTNNKQVLEKKENTLEEKIESVNSNIDMEWLDYKNIPLDYVLELSKFENQKGEKLAGTIDIEMLYSQKIDIEYISTFLDILADSTVDDILYFHECSVNLEYAKEIDKLKDKIIDYDKLNIVTFSLSEVEINYISELINVKRMKD